MSARTWTDSQREGITYRDGSMLVSAAAGTGKTTVLTQRCVQMVTGEPPLDIDRLLVVTFTEAAALEMRTRIRQALRDGCARRPGDRRLARQVTLLDAASISTLHSFCLQVVRENFSLAGLEPDIQVLDEDEAQLLRGEVLDALFQGLYDGCDDRSRLFADLVARYGEGRDGRIRDHVAHLHEYLRSLPPDRREAWMGQALAAYRLTDGGGLTGAHFADLRAAMADEIDLLIDRAEVLLAAFARRFESHKGLDQGYNILEQVRDLRGRLDRVSSPDALDSWLADAAQVEWKTCRWGEVPDPCREWARWLCNQWRDHFGPKWFASAGAWAHGIGMAGPFANLLLWLVGRFDEAYLGIKRAQGRIDYSDMEEHAWRLLAGPDSSPSPVARAYQRRFEAILVDEFQDINPIQEALLRLISRESAEPPTPNLFTVGDIKQSIYGFRMTEPRLFLERQQHIDGRAIAGRCITLQENFRSRPELLDTVNRVFRRLLRADETDVAYDALAELRPGRSDYGAPAGPAVEFHLLDGGRSRGREQPETSDDGDSDTGEALADREREAFLIARRIQRLHAQGTPYRDMVILLRSTKSTSQIYADVLRRQGVPVYAELRSGYFATREVKDMLNLLQVLENMRQDIPLAAVLRSPILGEPLSDADLADIRLERPDVPFHLACKAYAAEGTDAALRAKLAARLEGLHRWRSQARFQPLCEVIGTIYRETGLLEYIALRRDGLQCRANLVSLYERARQFGGFARQGLRRFVRFIDEMIKAGREAAAPTAISEAEDVVRIMSIHASKGLEFPVVFLADLAKKFNDADIHSSVVVDRAGLLGLEARDPARMLRSDTLIKMLAAQRVRRANRAEELRVLYVAMTRAKERLILVGTTRATLAEWLDEQRLLWPDHEAPLPRHCLRYATCTLDWLVPALLARDAAGPAIEFTQATDPADPTGSTPVAGFCYPREATDGWQIVEPAAGIEGSRILAALSDAARKVRGESKATAQAIARLTNTYAFEGLTGLAATQAASLLKGRLDWLRDDDSPPEPLGAAAKFVPNGSFAVPRRLRAAQPSDAARQKGTATHLLLERIDLGRPLDRPDLDDQLRCLVEARILSQAEADQIDMDSVYWLLNETAFGRAMRDGRDTIRREQPFILRMPPQALQAGLVSEDPADSVIVRGVIDVLWFTPEGIEIADFKTDDVSGRALLERITLYRDQLNLYAHAIGRIWAKPVQRCWLAFLSPRHIEPFTPAPLRG